MEGTLYRHGLGLMLIRMKEGKIGPSHFESLLNLPNARPTHTKPLQTSTLDVISGMLHERCTKKGVLGGGVASLFFQAKRRIEKLSEVGLRTGQGGDSRGEGTGKTARAAGHACSSDVTD
jgi:hypothetical protein